MKIAFTSDITTQEQLRNLADHATSNVEKAFSDLPGASAIWDAKSDPHNRPLVILSVRDLFASAKGVFAPDELKSPEHLDSRLHTLRGELLQGKRRILIGIRDQVVGIEQLERLRQELNRIPNISEAGLKMDNRVSMDGQFVLVSNFTVEVDAPFVGAVKDAILKSGFTIRTAPLVGQKSVVDAVKRLAAAHVADPELTPKHIVWFRLDDPENIHLLEVSDNAFDPGDGSLQGIALNAGNSVPGARSIVIYIASPSELRKAFDVNPNHPAVRALLERQYRVVYPDESGSALQEEFPEMAGAPV